MGEDIVISEPNVGRVEKAHERHRIRGRSRHLHQRELPLRRRGAAGGLLRGKEGVFTNSDRRVQRVRKAVEPPGQARADWQILVEIMKRAGLRQPDYRDVGEIYAEMASLSPKFAGISHHRIEREGGLQWPVETPDAPSTEFLHKGGVLRGKGLFQAVEFRPPFELADPEYPLVLSTGRTLYHYNAATQTRRSEGLSRKQPEAFVEISRRDAASSVSKTGRWSTW